jgi:hypothetical protein
MGFFPLSIDIIGHEHRYARTKKEGDQGERECNQSKENIPIIGCSKDMADK